MRIGYARVSSADQSVDGQVFALEAAGCEKVFVETASGAKKERRVLAEVLDYLRPSDVLAVFKLDRVARSLPHLLEVMEQLKCCDIGFQSLWIRIFTNRLNSTD